MAKKPNPFAKAAEKKGAAPKGKPAAKDMKKGKKDC